MFIEPAENQSSFRSDMAMPLLKELGSARFVEGYKHLAPNGALFQCTLRILLFAPSLFLPAFA